MQTDMTQTHTHTQTCARTHTINRQPHTIKQAQHQHGFIRSQSHDHRSTGATKVLREVKALAMPNKWFVFDGFLVQQLRTSAKTETAASCFCKIKISRTTNDENHKSIIRAECTSNLPINWDRIQARFTELAADGLIK